MNFNFKKIGIWSGGFIGSFLLLTVAVYFIYPYLNPKKAKKIQTRNQQTVKPVYGSADYAIPDLDRLQTEIKKMYSVNDSLKQHIQLQEKLVNTLKQKIVLQQQIVDSLNKQLESPPQARLKAGLTASGDKYNTTITEISKSLLTLDEEALAPIVDLMEPVQLVSLYQVAGSRQRKKLLRALKPEKAAQILKMTM